MTQTEALKQLREVHATQSRDGCWDIDDYMLGLYNGLELALSIFESRECRYKQRPKSQPEQEPVAHMYPCDLEEFKSKEMCAYAYSIEYVSASKGETIPLYTTPPHCKPLTDEMVVAAARMLNERQADACGVDRDDQWAIYSDDFKADARAMLEAAHNIKE